MECGYDRLAELQEEILWLCEAAHTPVIWATQVLEGLAKTGQPSRAEITDAVVGERAECVMLNKGRREVGAAGKEGPGGGSEGVARPGTRVSSCRATLNR